MEIMEEPERTNLVPKMWNALTRKKPLAVSYIEESALSRVLGLIDLTALGVAATLGMGVYIMAGSVARIAGPGLALSFFIAGVAATLSALCYGEFAARVPKSGSAYIYSYVTMGEFVAFIVGWNLGLEYVIGTACVARGLSNYIDSLIDDRMSIFFSSVFTMDVPFLATYPDFFGFFIMIFFSCIVAFGVELSSSFNKLFVFLNLATLSIVIVAGGLKADIKNWMLKPEEVPADTGGAGGFLPFGFMGVLSGAAKCFYSYTGFDCVATTGEEAKNPQKLIPIALLLTLMIAFVAYLGIAVTLTLMWPYYDQSVRAPFPYAFHKTHMEGVKGVVTTGALCALCACMVGSVYGTSRIIYSMAVDGLLFKVLGRVHPRTQTPLAATLIIGVFTGVIATVFDMEQLVDMTSIGTLMAYTIVSFCILLLRYDVRGAAEERDLTKGDVQSVELNRTNFLKLIFNINKSASTPTLQSSIIVKWLVLVFVLASIALGSCVTMTDGSPSTVSVLVITVSAMVMVASLLAISRQPQTREQLSFKVWFVPFLPAISSFMNIFLMLMLNFHTWMRFVVWMILGFLIYFGYGIRHSVEARNNKHHKQSDDRKGYT